MDERVTRTMKQGSWKKKLPDRDRELKVKGLF